MLLVHSRADPLDFPFEADVGFRLHAAADFLAQRLDVGARRATEIEQEIAMLFRDLGVAHRQAAAAGRVDQRPRLVAGRVLEGRAAGAAAQRLRIPRGRGRSRPSRRRSPRDRQARRGRSLRPRPRRRARRCGDRCSRAVRAAIRPTSPERSTSRRRDEDVADFAAISAAVHPDEAADGAGNAAQEFETRRCRRRGRSRRRGCRSPRRRSAGVVSSSRSIFANALPRRTTTPRNAAVADDQVRAEAQRHHRQFGIELAQGNR